MKSFRSHLRWIIPLSIFVVALTARIYRLPDVYMFGADEEYQATYARTISDDFHVVWIGVSAANTGIYLGPYWTYLTALIFTFTGGSPLATGYVAALIGALTAGLIYLLGRELVGKRASLIASILYALSPLAVYFDQKYWNPSTLPLLALLLVYSASRMRDKPLFLYLLAILIGLIFHVHLSLLPLAIFLVVYSWRNLLTHGLKHLALALILFLLTISPLLVFDYYHDYSNLTAPLRWREISLGLSGSSESNAERAVSLLGRLWYLTPGLSNANEALPVCEDGALSSPNLFVIIFAILPLMFVRKKRLLFQSFLAIIVPFVLYPGNNYEYYLLGAVPLYFLLVSPTLTKLRLPTLLPLIFLFALLALQTLRTNDASYGLSAKRELIEQTTSYLGQAEFALVERGDCHKYEGWRYLYSVYGHRPATSSTDSSLGWLYPQELGGIPEYQLEIYGTGEIPRVDGEYFYSGGFTAVITKL